MDELLIELKKCYGQDAEFREGQAEAVLGILEGKRILVVQKTGWGKSLVYFLGTKILRKRSKMITLIISPLLSLMNNQIDSASKLGLCVKTINSENAEKWDEIKEALNKNEVDALIISPERLSNDDFKSMLVDSLTARIGLFVVDEAHCISDWGHDFRPDYRRIINIINKLPSNIPILATTATANDRVVNDIKQQLGRDLLISRGSLMRKSLALQVIKLSTKEERLAWLASHINSIVGTGIIYCLTIGDCKLVHKWLEVNGIPSKEYYAEISAEEKALTVEMFMKNEIKVLVATVAFGMGFDKPDIGFVIHFQKPGNIVAYYQQIGRAGRAIDKAYAILLCGEEDDEINNYFIDSAFPTEELMTDIVNTIISNPGIRQSSLEVHINMKKGKIEKCLDYLLVNGEIYKEKGKFYKTPRPWIPDTEKSKKITAIRKEELKQMNDFTRWENCYMKYIADMLDDPYAQKCHNCANCMRHPLISEEISTEMVARAQQFIKDDFNIIKPRKMWPVGFKIDGRNKIEEKYLCETGCVLSNYNDAGWGKLVSTGKYKNNNFDEQLVEAAVNLLKSFVMDNNIEWITNISSLRRPDLVRNFTKSLAKRLDLEYRDTIQKIDSARCQKELNTNYLQCNNAYNSFEVNNVLEGNVLLVDDMVDSRWTFTVCGYKLRKKGCGKIFPFALANTGGRNGDE